MSTRGSQKPYPFTANPLTNTGSTPIHYPSSNNKHIHPQMASRSGYVQAATTSSTNLVPPSANRSTRPTFAQGSQENVKNSSLSVNSMDGSPYTSVGRASVPPSISDKFSLSPDPVSWGADLSPRHAEPDDYLHTPDPKRDRRIDRGGSILTSRGVANLGCLFVLCAGLLTLFAGYPMISHFTKKKPSTQGGFNIGGINATGQIASMSGNAGLIDADTPSDAYTITSFHDGSTEMQLVFSDEFNTDGRTFYPGDDPYWEAVDMHYWSTNNLEWYDPAAITTSNGSLVITLEQKETHNLNLQGGMMSTWNKFCFTGGLFVANVILPGVNDIVGLWPAIWAMGNLGRAGYGASLDGMWPYTYDSCDVGTAPNQTMNGLPHAATVGNDPSANGALSYLPGQRLSRCTCPGESHPGPMHSDGTYVGRSAPEIDMFEAQVSNYVGYVSQSAQWAPFNAQYKWFNTSENLHIPDASISELNSYTGGALQQASSVVSKTNQAAYEGNGMQFSLYGFEYKPGFDGAYISWISDGKLAWSLLQAGFAADTNVEIGSRPVPQEPMYLLMNLGASTNFGTVDLDHIPFPVHMYVDYIRVYQPKDAINVGCDPVDFPTAAYINEYIEAYTNPNLTTWVDDYKQKIPRNSFVDGCS